MKKLCTRCLYIGMGRHGLFSGNIYVAIAQISLGIALIAVNIDTTNLISLNWTQIIVFTIAVLSILVGILNLMDARKPGLICPRCNKPGMLDVESAEGQRFIKEKQIKIPQ